jgi:hypothetical protein
MLWFYERRTEAIRLEASYDNACGQFVATLVWPDGREQVERFSELSDFRRWLAQMDQALLGERWTPSSPIVLPYGWPDKRLT